MTFLFAVLFTVVPLVWLPWTSELFEFNKLMATYTLAVLIGGIWVIRMIREKSIIFRRTPLDIPLLIFLGFSILSLVFSQDIHTSWYGYYSRWNGGLLSLVTYAFLYWAYVSNMDKKATMFNIQCSISTAFIIAIYGTLEHFGRSISCLLVTPNHVFDVSCWVQDVQNRVYATLGQPNWMAAYIVALIFVPLASVLSARGQGLSKILHNTWHLAISTILFLALLFTKSRSGLLAFAISSVIFWGYLFVIHKSKLIIHSIIFALCILLFSFVIKNPIRDLILRDTYTLPLSGSSSLETGGTESGSIRKIVWTGALRIWLGNVKNFMIGTGPETFAQSYYQYRPREHNDTSEWELLYNKAHNEFLNQLATTGLLGFTAYLVLLITMLVNFKFQISNLQIALFAGWLTILVTNFWGFSVVITQLFLYLFPAMAIIHNTQEVVLRKQKIQLNYWQLFSITGAIFAICYLLFAIGSYWHADIKYASGSGAHKGFQMSNDPQYLVSAFQNYFRAYQLNPNEPVLISEFGLASAYLATALRADATSSSQLASQSLALSQKAINISPRHPNYYKNFTRGLILLSEIDPKYLNTAIDIMQMVSQISPTDPRIPYYMGVIRTSQGATTEAKLYFQKALDLKPDFADAQRQLNTTQVTGVSTESSSVKNSLQGNGD